LQFEELESSATEDEIAAEMAVAKTTTVAAYPDASVHRGELWKAASQDC
jgi:hypothetical protein